MRYPFFSSALITLFLTGVFSTAFAQTSSSSQSADSRSQPASQQNSAQNSTPVKQDTPRKVWTEDDLHTLKGSVSVGGGASKPANAPRKPGSQESPTGVPPEKDPAWYRAQMAPFLARIEQIDAEIRKLKGIQDGKETSDAGRSHGFALPLNSADRIEFLGKKKKELQDKVTALEDQARHNGINPGELR